METKTFKSKYEYPVYIIEGDEIKEMSMKEYLQKYWRDMIETPEGYTDRTKVLAILLSRDGKLMHYSHDESNLYSEYYMDEDGRKPEIKYGTFSWIEKSGKYSFVWNRDEYNTYDEACECILDYLFYHFETKKHDAPDAYPTRKTAELRMKGERFYKEFGRYLTIMEQISKNYGKYNK